MVLKQLSNPEAAQQPPSVLQAFQDAYKQQLTTIIAVTGAAMAPAINAVSGKLSSHRLAVRGCRMHNNRAAHC